MNKKELDKFGYEIKNKNESLQRLTSEILYCEKQLHKYKIKEDNGRTLSSDELFYKVPESNAYNFLRKKQKNLKQHQLKFCLNYLLHIIMLTQKKKFQKIMSTF